MKLSDLFLNRWLYKDVNQNLETKDSVFDSSNVIPADVPAVAAGSSAQDINTSNVTINGNTITPGTLILTVGDWGWGQTCVFSSTDFNTVAWTGGTFKSASGALLTILAGNTDARLTAAGLTSPMNAKVYIYLDLNISSDTYQCTYTPGDSVGIGKVLIAVAKNDTTVTNLATYNLTEANQIVGDNILANTINASKMNVGQLSAITADIGAITSGSITGTTIQTSATGARVVIGTGNDVSLYDDTTGGGGTVTGNSATLNFLRTDDASKGFTFVKRAGMNFDADNVLECYAHTPAAGRFNVWFNGRDGIGNNRNLSYYQVSVNHDSTRIKDPLNGYWTVEVGRDGAASNHPALIVADARAAFNDDTKSGQVVSVCGGGTDGLAGIGYEQSMGGGLWASAFLLYCQGLNAMVLGAHLNLDANNAYDIGGNNGVYSATIGNLRNLFTNSICLNGVTRTTWATGTTTLSGLTIDTSKDWQGYNITNAGTLQGTLLNINASSAGNYINGSITIAGTITCYDVIPNSNVSYNLGSTSRYFDWLYNRRIEFYSFTTDPGGSTYGQMWHFYNTLKQFRGTPYDTTVLSFDMSFI